MPSRKRTYARYTLAATEFLGTLIRTERKSRGFSEKEMAERLGVSRGTLQRLEKGDPKIALGAAFEACALLNIPLFNEDSPGLDRRTNEMNKRLALLPTRVRSSTLKVSDDF